MKARPTLEIQFDETKIEVVVHDDGEFFAEWEGETFHATSLKALKDKLAPKVKGVRKRISLKLTKIDYGGRPEVVEFVGLHGNGNLLVRNQDGSLAQTRAGEKYLPLISKDERAAYDALVQAEKDASKAVETWVRARLVKPRELVEAALGKAQA